MRTVAKPSPGRHSSLFREGSPVTRNALLPGAIAGTAPFAGVEPNGRSFSTSVMNFYSFDEDGKIVSDVAATGIAGILQGIGAVPDVR